MGENRRRNIQVKLWVTPDEHIKILEKAKFSNMKIGRYIRNSALKRKIIVYDLSSLFELSAQISKVGNNINQIAKKLNQGGLINKNEINYLTDTLNKIDNVLLQINYDIQKSIDLEE